MKILKIFFLYFIFVSCSNKYYRHLSEYQFHSLNGEPDYSSLNFWAAHPYKHNTSDSVSKPLLANYHPDSTVDIFFIHPTTYTGKKTFGMNAPIDNDTLNAKTDYSTILYQASVFNEAGRIFSPRYRQAYISAYFPKIKQDTVNALAAFDLAYSDIKKAFEYYLQHYNNGRPIIIASHSQGTTHAKKLLKEFFDSKVLQNKLVAAYLIGMPVEPNYFSNIQPCNSPNETGCFCSWRTFKEGYVPAYVEHENFTAVVTNPITWDSSKPYAARVLNKGGVFVDFNKKYRHVADAEIHNGILWTRKPKFFGNIFYVIKNYHIADYNLYYYNIRENVRQRINAFWKK